MRYEYVVAYSFVVSVRNSLVTYTPGYVMILIQFSLLLEVFWLSGYCFVTASNGI